MVTRTTTPSVGLDAVHSAVLDLLIAGATRDVIARKLHICVRTADTRVAALLRRLSAPTMFAAGVAAIRRHHVDAQSLIASTGQGAADPPAVPARVEPTARQSRILRLLATGASDEDVAAEIGRSVRTVRREVTRLATANGVTHRTTAGALFEALGWITGRH